ncbi:MAG: (Na+)-NQR maturation NqrM [Gammaproteobacteria bacterium]|nr:(Na+)-NQR maturation NqrM [Gammaproteobacteria bacterium]
MIEFLLTLVIVLVIVAGMAIGVIVGRKPISGSCGGLADVGVGGPCEICGGDASKCEEESSEPGRDRSAAKGFYDASR